MRTFDEVYKKYTSLNEGLIVSYDVRKLKSTLYQKFPKEIEVLS